MHCHMIIINMPMMAGIELYVVYRVQFYAQVEA